MAGNALSGDARRLLLADPDAIAARAGRRRTRARRFRWHRRIGSSRGCLSCTLPGTQCRTSPRWDDVALRFGQDTWATGGRNVKRCHPSRRSVSGTSSEAATAWSDGARERCRGGRGGGAVRFRRRCAGAAGGFVARSPRLVQSIQAAVDSARSGDWILVGPGDYHERGDRERRYRSLAEQGAGVMITKPRLHLRGMNRNRVVIDGTKPSASRCSRAASNQDFGPRVGGKANGRNGVEVYKAAGVTVENLTACNFLEGEGSSGNQIWFNFGDGPAGASRARSGALTSTRPRRTTRPASQPPHTGSSRATAKAREYSRTPTRAT